MLAFIGAMDSEVEAICKLMDDYQEIEISHTKFYQGHLASKPCVIMLSGIGQVNAAISTTILMENFAIDGVCNIGTAGGLLKDMQVLDVVISNKVAQYDLDIPSDNWPKGFNQDKTAYQADANYISIMKKIMLDNNDRVWLGNIASGDTFVCKEEHIQRILKDYPDAMCAEMEASAVARCCFHYQKPFIVIRSLSDIAHQENNALTFDEYLEKASKRSAIWCKKFIELL